MSSSKAISLVGLPGAGKTVIGRQVAQKLHRRFFDSDHVIEERLGCSIRAFFEHEGEAAFRAIENQTIAALSQTPDCVISTGGGAVLWPQNRALLREHSHVVYLHTAPQVIAQRLQHDKSRPLLQGVDLLTRLQDLYDARDALYRETAHCVVTVVGRSNAHVPAVVRAVLQQLQDHAGISAPEPAPERPRRT